MADKSINEFDNATQEEAQNGKVVGNTANGTTKVFNTGDFIERYTGECTQAVGGIAVGKTYNNASITEVIDNLINPYKAPSITSFTASNTGVKKKGTSVASVVMTVKVTKNTKAVTQIRFYVGNTVVETVTSGVGEGGTFSYTYTPQTAITTDTTFKADVTDGTQSVTSSTVSLTFVNPYYYGVTNSDITAEVVVALTELVQAKGNKELNYTATAQHGVFAYPASYGNLSHILDPNGYENISGWTKSNVTIGEVSYNVYRSDDALTCSNFKYRFQY